MERLLMVAFSSSDCCFKAVLPVVAGNAVELGGAVGGGCGCRDARRVFPMAPRGEKSSGWTTWHGHITQSA